MPNPTFVGAVVDASGGGTGLSVNHVLPAGKNRIIIASCGWEASSVPSVSSITYDVGGVATLFTKISSGFGSAGDSNGLEVWYLKEEDLPATGGTYEVRVQYGSGLSVQHFMVFAIKDANQAGIMDFGKSDSGSGSSLNTTLDPTEIYALAVTCVIWDGPGQTLTPDTGQDEIFDEVGGGGQCAISTEVCVGVTTYQKYTASSGDRCVLISAAWEYEPPPGAPISWFM